MPQHDRSGLLHGFQALADTAIEWPLPLGVVSARDAAAGSWAQLVTQLR